MNKEIESIKKKIVPILKTYKVTKAGIFGSYARGEQNKRSDVDILIEIGDEADIFDLINLRSLLQKILKKKGRPPKILLQLKSTLRKLQLITDIEITDIKN